MNIQEFIKYQEELKEEGFIKNAVLAGLIGLSALGGSKYLQKKSSPIISQVSSHSEDDEDSKSTMSSAKRKFTIANWKSPKEEQLPKFDSKPSQRSFLVDSSPEILQAVQMIKDNEKLILNAYYDPSGVLTAGYGTTGYVSNEVKKMVKGTPVTKQWAENELNKQVNELIRYMNKKSNSDWQKVCPKVKTSLIDLGYNAGIGAMDYMISNFLNKISSSNSDSKNNKILLDMAKSWSVYKYKSGFGDILGGLLTRRRDEIGIFLSPTQYSQAFSHQKSTIQQLDKRYFDKYLANKQK